MEPPLDHAAAPPAAPPQHHETTLTLTLALPLPALISLKPRPRRPRPEGGANPRPRYSATGDTPPSPCTECGKRFPSWKALFGHMRCHPERPWRGITPPSSPHSRHGPDAGQFTMQEREVATSLLVLSGARPGGGKGKKAVNVSAITPSATTRNCASSAASTGQANCDDHKCSVCDRGFASGQALGGHKRRHWDKACAGMVVIATAAGSGGSPVSSSEAAVLDLNLPPSPGPGTPPALKSDQGSSLNDMLDLKLGY